MMHDRTPSRPARPVYGPIDHRALRQDVMRKFPKTLAYLAVDIDREDDGRWIADIPELPGVMAYGNTEADARASALSLALRVLNERDGDGQNN
jgi:predicted RNase H-like HicB family nuclease